MNNTTNSTTGGLQPFAPLSHRVISGTIAVTAFIANLLFILLLIWCRCLLSKPYNIIIFHLAVTDMLTGLVMLITPNTVLSHDLFTPTAHQDGFCQLITSRFLLHVFTKASLMIVTCLAIERWFAIIKPFVYRIKFTKTRTHIYIGIMWLVSFALCWEKPTLMKIVDGKCRLQSHEGKAIEDKLKVIFYTLGTFLLPVCIMWGTFAQVYLRMRSALIKDGSRAAKAKTALLRMCAITAFAIFISWAPAEIWNMAKKFIDTSFEDSMEISVITLLLGFSNSCTNPVVYCLTNRIYREKAKSVIRRISHRRNEISASDNPSTIECKEVTGVKSQEIELRDTTIDTKL